MTPHALFLAVISALVVLSIYRRFRRSFGRQPIHTPRLIFQVMLFSVAIVVFLVTLMRVPHLLAGSVLGLLAGAALAILGLRLTRFEWGGTESFYTPNRYIGALLFAVLIGRLFYRFSTMATALESAGQPPTASQSPDAYLHSPLTLAIMLALVGYYLVYFGGILVLRKRHTE